MDLEAHKREVEAYERELEAIKVQLRERDEVHKREVEALKGQIEQSDQRLKAKDQWLAKAENESSDTDRPCGRGEERSNGAWETGRVVPVNLLSAVSNNKSLLGTVTQSEAWHSLEKSGHAKDTSCISKQNYFDAERLAAKFAAIKRSEWKEEADMYPDMIKSALYSSPPPAINVVDTSKLHEFPADVSIADYLDGRVPYGVRYFIELN